MNNTNIREAAINWYDNLRFDVQRIHSAGHGRILRTIRETDIPTIEKLYQEEHPQQPESLLEQMAEVTKPDNVSLGDLAGLKSGLRRIKTQQGFSQHILELSEEDAIIYTDLLTRNKIWFADITGHRY